MTRLQQSSALIRKYTILALIALCLIAFGFSQASAQQEGAGDAQQNKELQEAKQKAQKYSEKLREIQKAAMEKNPELKKQREELKNLQKEKMNEIVSENATRMEKLKARMKLRQDKELQEKRKSLQEDFLEAMKKEDPKTQDYLDEFSNARKKIRKINQQRQQQGQGQGQGMQQQQ